jgi:hypothetical protein
MSTLEFSSVTPLSFDMEELLKTLSECGNDKLTNALYASPYDFFESINLFKNRTKNYHMLSLGLHYGIANPLTFYRDFPNFGLPCKSNSTIFFIDNKIRLNIHFTIRSNTSWQKIEINECINILENNFYVFDLLFTPNMEIDWHGKSFKITTDQDIFDTQRTLTIPSNLFKFRVL